MPFEEACVPLIVNREDQVTENNGTFEVKSTETDQVDHFYYSLKLSKILDQGHLNYCRHMASVVVFIFICHHLYTFTFLYPLQRSCRGVYWFHHVRPSVDKSYVIQ